MESLDAKWRRFVAELSAEELEVLNAAVHSARKETLAPHDRQVGEEVQGATLPLPPPGEIEDLIERLPRRES